MAGNVSSFRRTRGPPRKPVIPYFVRPLKKAERERERPDTSPVDFP